MILKVRNLGGALIGQGLNFVAMLLPILGAETRQLVYLMLPLALATVLSRTSVLGFHSRYLTVRENLTRTATSVSLLSLCATTSACGLVSLILLTQSSSAAAVTGWTALLVLANGLYVMAVAVVTQEERMSVYSTARLWYGVINITATALVVFITPFTAGLVLVAVLNPLAGAVLILSRTSNRLLPEMWRDRHALSDHRHRGYLAGSLHATGATFLSESGFQIQGFLTPFMGQYQEAWAVVVRLTGGFGTLGQQVIAPSLEAKIAAAIRTEDHGATSRWSRYCALGGTVLGALCAGVQTGALLLALRGESPLGTSILALTAIYCTATLATSLSAKIPLMKGFDRAFLLWSAGRLVVLLALLLTSGGALLTGIVIAQTVASIALLALTLCPVGEHPHREVAIAAPVSPDPAGAPTHPPERSLPPVRTSPARSDQSGYSATRRTAPRESSR